MKKILALIPVVTLILTACGGEKYTTDYLYKNPAKRHEVLKACAENKESKDNCVNANTAQATVSLEIGNKKSQIGQLEAQIRQDLYMRAKFPGNRTTGNDKFSQARDAKIEEKKAQLEKLKAELNDMVAAQQAK